jgi:hypothetical protein
MGKRLLRVSNQIQGKNLGNKIAEKFIGQKAAGSRGLLEPPANSQARF